MMMSNAKDDEDMFHVLNPASTNYKNHNNNNHQYDDMDDDDDPLSSVILRGELANLAALKQTETQLDYMKQREPWILSRPIPCQVSWKQKHPLSSLSPSPSLSATDNDPMIMIQGNVFVSGSQLLFVTSTLDSVDYDFAIGAKCIHLHAMAEEPELSIYLQLTEDNKNNNNADQEAEETCSELSIIPLTKNTDNDHDNGGEVVVSTDNDCQVLFDSLCKLVSMHPLDINDDDDDNYYYSGNGGMFQSDDLIWVPSSSGRYPNNSGDEDFDDDNPNDQERTAMLDRLDNLLVIRPEFEITDGQFEDADEVDDIHEADNDDKFLQEATPKEVQ